MTHIFNDATERIRFIKFAIVGTIGAVVDFGSFNLLNIVFHVHPVVASMLSFSLAVTSNFMWNRYWTYPESRTKPIHHQATQFVLVNLGGLAIRTPLFAGLEHPLGVMFGTWGISAHAADVLSHNVALAIAVGVVMLWNYFVNRYWTYNDV